uniref:C-type lectin domain-containing protein n=1 Tax=Astyanax mexicanus TaxID=7994 RepID=W5KHK7_ASTMX
MYKYAHKITLKYILLLSIVSLCQNGWSRFGSRCFRVFTSSTTWTASEQNCVAMGGHLASVHSSEEYTFILNLLLSVTNNAAWIGGTDAAQVFIVKIFRVISGPLLIIWGAQAKWTPPSFMQ